MTKKKKALKERLHGATGVTNTQLSFWKKKYVWGDYRKISEETELSRPTVKLAFLGDAPTDVAEKITNYYLNFKIKSTKTKKT